MASTRRVTYVQTPNFTKQHLPELWHNIFVAGPPEDQRMFASMFIKARCFQAKELKHADFVVFSGGADVNPKLYGETPHPKTYYDDMRDQQDIALFNYCVLHGVPMVGVCRGAQFLHVMQGGKLFQDVDGHQKAHSMHDLIEDKVIHTVSSVHHQMCIPKADMTIVGVSKHISNKRWRNERQCDVDLTHEVEAFWYRDICAFGVQGHPEYSGYPEYTKWFLDQLNSRIAENPDLVPTQVDDTKVKPLRIRKDLLEKRLASRKWVVDPMTTTEGNA